MLTSDPPVHEAPPPEIDVVIREARRRQRRRWARGALAACMAGGLFAGVLVAAGAPAPPAGTHGGRGDRHGPQSSVAASVTRHVSVGFGSLSACPATPNATSITPALDGAFASCLRVGPLRPGPYHVVVTGYLTVPRYPRGTRLAPPSTRVHLTIRPNRGPPGTRVTVVGTVRAPARVTTTYGQVCWDGCADGLLYTMSKRWTSPTTFVEHFRVPAAPWMVASRAGTYRIHPLASGTYDIGVDCLVVSKGCGATTAGSGVFHLVVGRSARRHLCTSPTPLACLYVQLRRGAVRPADTVRVRGFAPLTSGLLGLEVLAGRARGPALRVGRAPKGGDVVHFAQADLSVRAAPRFESIRGLTVLDEQAGGPAPISSNPADRSRVGWCGEGMVGIARATGAPVAQVSTAGVASVIADAGIGDGLYPPTAACSDVALARRGPGIFAAFRVALTPTRTVEGYVALETTDGGASWTLVPAPPGARVTGFGGFRYQDGTVLALYAPAGTDAAGRPGVTPNPPLAQRADTSTGTWAPASLECPSGRPCLTFGTAEPGNCAMNGTSQSVLVSTDGATHWRTPMWPSQVNSCATTSLVATGPHSALFVNASSPYPLLRSTDGGRHWSDVALPAPPFTLGGLGPGMVLLPDGSLLAIKPGAPVHWDLLGPAAARWCALGSVPAGVRASIGTSSVTLDATALWWVSPAPGSPRHTILHRVGISTLHC